MEAFDRAAARASWAELAAATTAAHQSFCAQTLKKFLSVWELSRTENKCYIEFETFQLKFARVRRRQHWQHWQHWQQQRVRQDEVRLSRLRKNGTSVADRGPN